MNDYEFAQWFQARFDHMMRTLKDEDYVVNEEQQRKMFSILKAFSHQIREVGGKFNDYELIPRLQHGGITATFPIVSLSGKSVSEFCAALSGASAITMDATDDGVCISVRIPDVFTKKSNSN